MNITSASGSRLDLALERFSLGEDVLSFEFFSLRLGNDGTVEVWVESSFAAEHATQESVRRDISDANAAVERLIVESPEVAGLLASRPRRFTVNHTYGMGAVVLAHAEGSTFEWRPPEA